MFSLFFLLPHFTNTLASPASGGMGLDGAAHSSNRYVVDIVLFNHELEILFARLHELSPVVDQFFIFEAHTSFTGIAKPLLYETNKDVYERFAKKVTHVVFPALGINCTANSGFSCEKQYRRFAYTTAVATLVARGINHDVVLYADMDEIPRREVVLGLKAGKHKLPASFWLNTYKFSMHYIAHGSISQLSHAEATTSLEFVKMWSTCHPASNLEDCVHKERFRSKHNPIENAGWHLSTFGSVHDIWVKCRATSDNDRRLTVHEIETRLKRGMAMYQPLKQPPRYKYCDLPSDLPHLFADYPACAAEWLGRYSKGSGGSVNVKEPDHSECGITFKKVHYIDILASTFNPPSKKNEDMDIAAAEIAAESADEKAAASPNELPLQRKHETGAPKPNMSASLSRSPWTQGIANGCYHIFLDCGSNVGVHGRFLFEPHKYPKSKFAHEFDTIFGVDRTLQNICVFAFEPNPKHNGTQSTTQRAYSKMGWRYYYMPFAVSDRNGSLTFYHNSDIGHGNLYEEWGFSIHRSEGTATNPTLTLSQEISVNMIDLSRWLQTEIAGRFIPPKNKYNQGDPKVIIKMDIEGSEYKTLWGLYQTGAVNLVSEFYGETHSNTYPQLIGGKNYTSKDELNVFFQSLTANIRKDGGPSWRTFDDEEYLHDGAVYPDPIDPTTWMMSWPN